MGSVCDHQPQMAVSASAGVGAVAHGERKYMPVPGPVPWPMAPHTGAKHDIYRTYLAKWFPILLAGKRKKPYPSATYAEGFAGPGIYSEGQDGSPILAVRALVETVSAGCGVVKFVFIDDDPRCIALLNKQLLSSFTVRPRTVEAMPVAITEGTCAKTLESELDRMKSWGQPIFAVLDSWGNAPVPYRLIRRLAQNPATEVIVTLQPQHFVRFVEQMSEGADDVFGGNPAWRNIVAMGDPEEKRRHLLTAYREMLAGAGFSYLLDFELIDRRGQLLYLVFATNHHLGVEKMKDSLWAVDPAFGIGFRDPRDVLQQSLFEPDEAELAPLAELLAAHLTDVGRSPVASLRRFALLETIFRPQQVIGALQSLRDAGRLTVEGGGPIRIASLVTIR